MDPERKGVAPPDAQAAKAPVPGACGPPRELAASPPPARVSAARSPTAARPPPADRGARIRAAAFSPPVILVAFAAGIACEGGIPWSAAACAFAGGFLWAACVRRVPAMMPPLLFLALGAWRSASLPARLPPPVREPYPAAVQGTVLDPPLRDAERPLWRFSVRTDGIRTDVRAPFPPNLREGDRVRLIGAFAPHWYGGNPGDAARFARERARWRCGAMALKAPGQIELIARARAPVPVVAAAARGAIRELFPPSLEGLALGLFLGDRRGIPRRQQDEFTRAGTAHLLAISGLHVGLFASAIYFFALRLLGSRLRRGRPWGQRLALGASASGALCYAVLSGYSPSAARAAIGLILAALVLLLGRRPRSMDLLCAVVFTVLYLDPELLWSISLQLSAAAVAGILRFGIPPPVPALARRITRPTRAGRAVALLLFAPGRISAAAFFGSLPLSVHHFGACHPWGIAASMATCPLMAVTLTCGGCAIACAPGSLLLAKILALPSALALHGIVACNSLFASMPWDTVPFPATRSALIGAAVLSLLLPRARAAMGCMLAAFACALLFPAPCRLPQGMLVCDFPGSRAVFYRAGDRIAIQADGVRARDLAPVLRALALDSADVLAARRPLPGLPLTARIILSEPGAVSLDADLRVEALRSPSGGLELRFTEGGALVAPPPRAPPSSRAARPPLP